MAAIILTGFMGTGKTAVGREVARRLGRPFVDTDALVEQDAGLAIAEIFAQFGEGHFRTLERAAIARACSVADAVIATGGGAMLDPENQARMKAAGHVICLAADVDTILRRTDENTRRPLLRGENARERVSALLAERADAYAAADRRVDTSGRSVAEVADAVLDALP
jgi:shikimate kinase